MGPLCTNLNFSVSRKFSSVKMVNLLREYNNNQKDTSKPSEAFFGYSHQTLRFCFCLLIAYITFSMSSMVGCKSIPKSIKTQGIPCRSYSSCSITNIKWLKYCCSFSFVKLMQSCSKPLYWAGIRKRKKMPRNTTNKVFFSNHKKGK